MTPTEQIANLILKHLRDELNTEEASELQRWINQSPDNQEFFSAITDPKKLNDEVLSFYESKVRIYQKIKLSLPSAKVFSFPWKRWAAAAVLLILAAGSYFIFFTPKPPKGGDTVAETTKDVEAPKITKATITLDDGRIVSIDSLTTLSQNNVKVTKTADGRLVYTGFGSEVTFNTLTNPRGSKVIDMTLADGSHVWLNAGSSVKFPIAFTGNERKVEITGEAYFEVSHDKVKPFIVQKETTSVTVLGTHFNVNAYDDEDAIRVTLLEGAVKVNATTIRPGQQAKVLGTKVTVANNVDIAAVMAWKNGHFELGAGDVKSIMRQISRWYDVEIVYSGDVPEKRFGGTLSREENVSKVLRYLEMTGSIHFKIEGKKITVLP